MQTCFLTIVLALLLLSGCSGAGKRYDVPVEERGTDMAQEKPDSVVDPPAAQATVTTGQASSTDNATSTAGSVISGNAAVLALLADAEKNSGAGRLDNAAATLERALNLEPKNPYLWHELAALRMRQRNWQQAYVLANKSNSLARGNNALQIRNWRIIVAAKRAQGDNDYADKAEAEIRRLQR